MHLSWFSSLKLNTEIRSKETIESPCGKGLNTPSAGKLPWKAVPDDRSLVHVDAQVTSIQAVYVALKFMGQPWKKHHDVSGGITFRCSWCWFSHIFPSIGLRSLCTRVTQWLDKSKNNTTKLLVKRATKPLALWGTSHCRSAPTGLARVFLTLSVLLCLCCSSLLLLWEHQPPHDSAQLGGGGEQLEKEKGR